MAARFKASKYKNAAPMEAKKEKQIKDLSIGSYNSCGNYIAASASFIAFNWDTSGSSLAVLPLSASGRQNKASIPRISGHGEVVTDFSFSPHDDGLLATGSQDCTVKLWRIPKEGLTGSLDKPELVLPEQTRRVETVCWHPTADLVLASTSGTGVSVWDLSTASCLYSWEGHQDWVQAADWQRQGKLLATHSKDRMLRVFDPRAGGGPIQETRSHEGMKDSKVVWVGENRLLTSGFSADRCRQLGLRDLRMLGTPQHMLSLDVSSGILVPLHDPDTNMVILAGKGDRYMQFVEVADADPWFVPGLRYTGEQTKGACIVPKRAMEVMQGEVVRTLQLAESSVVPVSWQVPRKTYRDFHADLFPDTTSAVPAMGPSAWSQGDNSPPAGLPLNPTKREGDLTRFDPSPLAGRQYAGATQETSTTDVPTAAPVVKRREAKEKKEISIQRRDGDSFLMPQIRPKADGKPANPRASKFGRQTKFKHFKGTTMAKSMLFHNLKNLSKSVAAESDIIKANVDRVAVPLAGPGGKVGVFETAQAGRLPDGVLPCVINTATVMDFAFDPFDNSKLVCATEEGTLNVWTIPEGGLTEQVNEPQSQTVAHGEKISMVKFHPTAEGILATVSYDLTIKIWSLSDMEDCLSLSGHTDQIYSVAWSQCGRFIASSCKDGKVRIYNPRQATSPVMEGPGVVPKKGSRIVWTNDGEFLVVTGFSTRSERTVSVYRTKDLTILHSEVLNVSPAVLIPFYDEDSSTLFLAGKGENTMLAYEVGLDHPHLHPLSPYQAPGLTQGYGWIQNKSAMKVREVEFARAYRLTMTSIEPVSFAVPRVKSTYFQDDIFPPTRLLWKPTVSGDQWLQGEDGDTEWVSLQPEDMKSLSGQAQNITPSSRPSSAPSNSSPPSLTEGKSSKAQEKGITEEVSGIIEATEELEQDKMETMVGEEEWDK